MKYQAIVLAGGESSRFYPFDDIHKGFFTLAGKRIIERTIESIKKTSVAEIILVLGKKNFAEEKRVCSDSKILKDIKITCQEKPLGMADAILAAQEFINNDFFVVNVQHFTFNNFYEDFIEKHERAQNVATVGLVETENPQKYGVAVLSGQKLVGVVEKPELGKEPSNLRLVGTYLFSPKFLEELRNVKHSEYSLEVALDIAGKTGRAGYITLDGGIPTLKYPWDILDLKNLVLEKMKFDISSSAKISQTAIIRGKNVYIGKNAQIFDFSIIEGPAFIGDGALVGCYSQVRGGTVLEANAEIQRYVDIKNSHIGESTHIHSGFIGDSVIGENVKVGANFIVANKRLDRGQICVGVKGEKINTQKTSLGVFIGNNTHVGINVSAMPGSVVSGESIVFPGTVIKGKIPV